MKRYAEQVWNKGALSAAEIGARYSGEWKHSDSPTWKCQTLSFWVFYGVSSHGHAWLNRWPLVIERNPQPPLPPPWKSGEVNWKAPLFMVSSLTSSHPWVLSKGTHCIMTSCSGKGSFIRITRNQFHLYGCEVEISGAEARDQILFDKDVPLLILLRIF